MTTPRRVAEFEPVRSVLVELGPVLRRAVALNPGAVARLRGDDASVTVFVRLPFDVLVGRTVSGVSGVSGGADQRIDVTVPAAETLAWLDDATAALPTRCDELWRGALPPVDGWARIESVPDEVIRRVVRAGAGTLAAVVARDGGANAQPRAEVADVLLDSVVLTVSNERGTTAPVTLRAASALTRMGFLARDSHAHVECAGRWTRLVGFYGSVYTEAPGGLALTPA